MFCNKSPVSHCWRAPTSQCTWKDRGQGTETRHLALPDLARGAEPRSFALQLLSWNRLRHGRLTLFPEASRPICLNQGNLRRHNAKLACLRAQGLHVTDLIVPGSACFRPLETAFMPRSASLTCHTHRIVQVFARKFFGTRSSHSAALQLSRESPIGAQEAGSLSSYSTLSFAFSAAFRRCPSTLFCSSKRIDLSSLEPNRPMS
jgi:hypothetical protein